MTKIYRTKTRRYNDQGGYDQELSVTVHYCGTDRDDALIAYYAHQPSDFYQGAGNVAQSTYVEEVDSDTVALSDPDNNWDTVNEVDTHP